MSFKFPYPSRNGGISRLTQIKFGGYEHTLSCSEGGIYDMQNLTADHYPVLSVRERRFDMGGPGGDLQSFGYFIYDGILIEAAERATDTPAKYANLHVTLPQGKSFKFDLFGHARRSFAFCGNYFIIMPDGKYLKKDELMKGEAQLYDMTARIISPLTIGDGTYGGAPAKANTITFGEGVDLSSLRVGDAVNIRGCTIIPENNKIAIIREIEDRKLIFYENTFTLPEGETEYTELSPGGDSWVGDGGQLELAYAPTATRDIPKLDFICVQNNRLWGAEGDRIYASALGDPLNFFNYEGVGGAWTLDVISAGDFTGITSYLSYVILFKENEIFKIYGDRPSNFSLSRTAALGIKIGSEKSCATAGEVLFYHSKLGIMAFSGGVPYCISECFGDNRYSGAVGGSDGRKYYVSLTDDNTLIPSLFVYDTETNLWMREDELPISDIICDKRLYFCTKDRRIYALPMREGERAEEELLSFAEFGDFYNSSPSKKATLRLRARLELEEGAKVSFLIRYDSAGEWQTLKTVLDAGKRSYNIPLRLKRCDHFRLRIEGEGIFRLYSLARDAYTGSDF